MGREGENYEGQLGLGQGGGCKVLPQKVEALNRLEVCAVAAAEFVSCAVTATGELYTWGRGYFGPLRHGDEMAQLAPKRVEALRDEWVVAVAPGSYHTIAVTRDGGVFGWGRAEGLGLPEAAPITTGVNAAGVRLVTSLFRFPQLSCVPRS